jgi:NodT family efflux transporter outer membrane factor (OMF) lipoprotein
VLAACTVGPDYERPPAIVPAAYKESGWKIGEPRDGIDRGAWWQIYRDPLLDDFERQIDISNQTLKASEAAYRQSQAIVAEALAGYYPTVTANFSATRSGFGTGGNGGVSSRGGGGGGKTLYDLTSSASWSIDLWGRIRRTVESDVAGAQASAADLASARLSAQAALATDYFNLRYADEQKRLLQAETENFARALQITRNQYNVGVAGASDVALAEAQTESTRAQSIAVGTTRAALEHAIAVLIGKPPAEFAIAETQTTLVLPAIPPELPSALLERRPDVAAQERLMASSNAQIGVATAAFYPDLTLSASYGFQSFDLGSLIQTANRFWSVGPALAQTVFDGGLRTAQVAQARAVYDQDVANYRQTVLTAFQQVEDALADLKVLTDEQQVQEVAVRQARQAERLILNQYLAGTVAYTSVITVQQTALANELTLLAIRQNRYAASIALINALGGGWAADELPSREQIEDGKPGDINRIVPQS